MSVIKRVGSAILAMFLTSCTGKEQRIVVPAPPSSYSGFYVIACQDDFVEPQDNSSRMIIQKDGSVSVHGFIFRTHCYFDCTVTPCVSVGKRTPKLWLGLEITELVKKRFGSRYISDLRPTHEKIGSATNGGGSRK